MERVLVTAIRDFDYQGRAITRGTVVEMLALDAALHIDQGKASGTRHPGIVASAIEPEHVEATTPEPEPPVETPPRRRRTYRRKDIIADPPA